MKRLVGLLAVLSLALVAVAGSSRDDASVCSGSFHDNCYDLDACGVDTNLCHKKGEFWYITVPARKHLWKAGPQYTEVCISMWFAVAGCPLGHGTREDFDRWSCGVTREPPGGSN